MSRQSSRRRFFQLAVAATTLPLLQRIATRPAFAELQMLSADNPQAKALGYVPDGTTSKHGLYKAGRNCANCQLFTAANNTCSAFPGFAVAPEGWCAAWMKKV